MSKKFICIIIIIACISALLGISFANFNQIKENVETIVENNAIELWKYKTEIEILGQVLKSYFIEGKNVNVSYYSTGPNYFSNATVTVGEWGENTFDFSSEVPTELTYEPTKVALDIVNKYQFLGKITYNQYENEIQFDNTFFNNFFKVVQAPLVIISLLTTICIIIITLVIDSISIVFNMFDLVFSLFNIG